MSHKHHNNNPFKNSENLDEEIKQDNVENSDTNEENTEKTNSELDELQKKYEYIKPTIFKTCC